MAFLFNNKRILLKTPTPSSKDLLKPTSIAITTGLVLFPATHTELVVKDGGIFRLLEGIEGIT